jgi:hypothetical protein
MKFYNIGEMTTAVNSKEKSNEEHKKKLTKDQHLTLAMRER